MADYISPGRLKLLFIKLPISILITLALLTTSVVTRAANRYAVATGNWSVTTTWSATSGGSAGASVPVAGDNVYIEGGRTVTINVNANCTNISIDNGSALNIGAYTTNFSGTTTINGSLTVTSTTGTKTFNQLIISGGTFNSNTTETYAISGLTLENGTITGTATGVFNVAAGGLLFAAGTINTIGRSTLTITGSTVVDGTVEFTSATGTKTFIGGITINGSWINTANEAITIRGGITNNGTFISGTGTYTFNTSSQILDGSQGLTFGNGVAISGSISVTNNTSVSIVGSLTGSTTGSTWVNASNSILEAGNAVLATGTLNASASDNLVNYIRAGTQTVKATTYYNLTLSGTSTKTTTGVTVNGTLSMEGTATASVVPTYGSTATLQYNVTTARTTGVEWLSPFNASGGIVINNTGTITMNAAKVVNAPLQINPGSTLNTNSLALTLGGDLINNGTFNTENNTVTLNGSSIQQLSGTSITIFNNLVLDNSSGLQLNSDENHVINGTLTFTNGKIITGTRILVLGSSSAVSGANNSNYIYGNLRKIIAAATTAKTFEIGDATAYTPVELVFSGTTNAGGYITAYTTTGDHPEVNSSGINSGKSVNRFWTLSNTGTSGFSSYSATFNFVIDDVDDGADFSSFIGGNYNSSAWAFPAVGTRTSTSTQIEGLNTFGDFQLGECPASEQPSIISGDGTPCAFTENIIYSVSNVAGITYQWTVPAGWTITSGQNTNQITVIVGANSGNISVTPLSPCGNGPAQNRTVTVLNSPDISILASASEVCEGDFVSLTASATKAGSRAIILEEGFNDATNNWLNINNTTGGTPAAAEWTLRPYNYNVSSTTFRSNDNSQFYLSNSDAAGSGAVVSTILQSPVIVTSGYSSLSLNFYHYYRRYNGGESGKVEVSTNGTDWTTVYTCTSSTGSSTNFVNQEVNLDAYIDNPTFYIRFKYDATYDWWWAIDNVSITGDLANPGYLYSWTAVPAATAGLPPGSEIPSETNFAVLAYPSITTTYTASVTNGSGCTANANATITVNPILPVSISISASNNPACAGSPVTFTATPVNEGVNPIFQWKLNGSNVGTNSPEYTISSLSTGDLINCELISDVSCPTSNPAISNMIDMVINPATPVNVSIVASENSVCSGSPVTLTATASSTIAPVVIMYEGFNNSSNDWTTFNNSTGGTPANAAWTIRPDGYASAYSGVMHSNDNSQFYFTDSDAQGSGSVAATILQSPAINTTGFSTLTLDFYQYFRIYANGETGSVEVSTNGTNWDNIVTFVSNNGASQSFSNISLNLDAYVGNATLYIRFKYDANWGYYWGIDNVSLTGTPSTTTFQYSWIGDPSNTAGLPEGAETPSISNASIIVNPSLTTSYTATALALNGCTGTENISISVVAGLPLSVSIATTDNPFCQESSVTFTATTANAGTNPTYQWKVDGTDAGPNNAVFTYASPSDGETVSCVVTANNGCPTGNPATSNTIVLNEGTSITGNEIDFNNGLHGEICANVAEHGTASLIAPAGTYFAYINFASYGTPNGTCPDFTYGACHATTSQPIVENALLGNNSGSILAENGIFGDPCSGTLKRLYIKASYTQPVCSGALPGIISGGIPAGGNGTFTYLWQISTTSSTSGFSAAPGTNNQQNYTPAGLTQNTWFRRIAYSGGCTNTSKVLQINVINENTWTGAEDNNWNNANNWTCFIPTLSTNVTINTGLINYPTLSSGPTGSVNNLSIASGASVVVDGNTLQIAGGVTNNGTFTASSGTIEMKGTLPQTIAANLFSGNTIKNLTINNTQGLSLLGDLNVSGVLLAHTGNFSTGGYLTLISTATQTALIDGSGSGEVNGNVTMQRYLDSGFGYRYFASPFQTATVNGFADDMDLLATFPSFYRYDENKETTGWESYTNSAGVLFPLSGYCLNFGSSVSPLTADLTGIVNNNAVGPLALFNHDKTYTQGFNLIGNPYPSPINWDAASGWTKTNIDNALYYFNAGTTDQYTGTYSTYINGVSSDGTASGIIPSMQGFFVHVSNGSYPVSATLAVDNRVRVNNLSPAFYKSAKDLNLPLVRLSAGFNDDPLTTDPVVVYFSEEATLGFDPDLDALKLMNTAQEVPNFYMLTEGNQKLSISAIPEPGETSVIPLGLKTKKSGWITISTKNIENIPYGLNTYLYDKSTGNIQDLRDNPDYRIMLDEGTCDQCFSLIFSKTSFIGEQVSEGNTFAYCADGILYINAGTFPDGSRILKVSNMLGQALTETHIPESGQAEIRTVFSRGIYILTLTSQKGIRSQKIFISY